MLPAWLPDTVTTVPDRMVERALLWGLEGLELRTVGGPSERVPAINESRLRRLLEESELEACSAIPGLFEGAASDRAAWMNELALVSETVDFCGRIGCGRIVVSSFAAPCDPAPVADVLRRAGDLAGRRGVSLVVLNEPGMLAATVADLADLLDRVDHPHVRAGWDPAHTGVSPELLATVRDGLGGRLALVRYPAAPGISGPGAQALFDLLVRMPFEGPVSLVLPPAASRADGLEAATGMIRAWREAAARARDQNTNPA